MPIKSSAPSPNTAVMNTSKNATKHCRLNCIFIHHFLRFFRLSQTDGKFLSVGTKPLLGHMSRRQQTHNTHILNIIQ